MKYLVDTNLLIWAAEGSPRLSKAATAILEHGGNRLWFSPLSIVEVAIKFARGRPDFRVDPMILHRTLLENRLEELVLTTAHAGRLLDLPPVHKDPFDRLMIAQALAEGVPFVTADAVLAAYPGQIIVV